MKHTQERKKPDFCVPVSLNQHR